MTGLDDALIAALVDVEQRRSISPPPGLYESSVEERLSSKRNLLGLESVVVELVEMVARVGDRAFKITDNGSKDGCGASVLSVSPADLLRGAAIALHHARERYLAAHKPARPYAVDGVTYDDAEITW